MNHFADIDEGLGVFDDENERQATETRFRSNPKLAAIALDGVDFIPRTVKAIHLVGSLRRDRKVEEPRPFDFEDGYLEAMGLFKDGRTGAIPISILVRWSDFGNAVQWNPR